MKTAISSAVDKLNRQTTAGTTIAQQHMRLFQDYRAGEVSIGLKKMIDGLESYCKGTKHEFGSHVGDDGFLSPYISDIINALLGLLSGPGKFDGGTLEEAIREIAKDAKIKIPN